MDRSPPNMIRQRVPNKNREVQSREKTGHGVEILHQKEIVPSGWKLKYFTAIMVLMTVVLGLSLWASKQRNKALSEELNALKKEFQVERNHWQLKQKTFQTQINVKKIQHMELIKMYFSNDVKLIEYILKLEKKWLQTELEFAIEKIKTLKETASHEKEKSSAKSKAGKAEQRIKELEEESSDAKEQEEKLQERLKIVNHELTTCQNEKDSWFTYGKSFATSALGSVVDAYLRRTVTLQGVFGEFEFAVSIGRPVNI